MGDNEKVTKLTVPFKMLKPTEYAHITQPDGSCSCGAGIVGKPNAH